MVDAVLPLPTVPFTRGHVTTSQARMYSNNLVWAGAHLGAGNNYGMPVNQWVLVDARPWFDSDFETKAAALFAAGIEIITGPNPSITADMRITFARPSDLSADINGYIGQAALAGYGGVRSGMATIIPVEAGFFKTAMMVMTAGDYPNAPAYGVNLTPQFWLEKEEMAEAQLLAVAAKEAKIVQKRKTTHPQLHFQHKTIKQRIQERRP